MTLTGHQHYTIGVDVGGTKIDTALVDSNGAIVSSHYRLVDPSKDPGITIADIVDSVRICEERVSRKASGLGIGIAGQIDKISGTVRFSPNLPAWHNVPLRAELENALRIPVLVNNDVRVITWGEWRHGAGKGIDDLVCLFVGTGVGGGIVSSGRLLEGSDNSAGELGHMTVVAGGRQCTCPNEGCLEAYAGGWAIAARAQDAVKANPSAGKMLLEIAGSSEAISAATVSNAYRSGDALAQRLVKDTAKYLAAGVVSIVNAFNPSLIIMGGGVIGGLPEYVELVERRVRPHALPVSLDHLRITLGALGNKAGIIGAAALARSAIRA